MTNDTPQPPMCKHARHLPYGINCSCRDIVIHCKRNDYTRTFYKPLCPFYHRDSHAKLAPVICKYYETPLSPSLTIDERLSKLEQGMHCIQEILKSDDHCYNHQCKTCLNCYNNDNSCYCSEYKRTKVCEIFDINKLTECKWYTSIPHHNVTR